MSKWVSLFTRCWKKNLTYEWHILVDNKVMHLIWWSLLCTSQSASQSVRQSVSRSVGRSTSWSVGHSVVQGVSRPANQSAIEQGCKSVQGSYNMGSPKIVWRIKQTRGPPKNIKVKWRYLKLNSSLILTLRSLSSLTDAGSTFVSENKMQSVSAVCKNIAQWILKHHHKDYGES